MELASTLMISAEILNYCTVSVVIVPKQQVLSLDYCTPINGLCWSSVVLAQHSGVSALAATGH